MSNSKILDSKNINDIIRQSIKESFETGGVTKSQPSQTKQTLTTGPEQIKKVSLGNSNSQSTQTKTLGQLFSESGRQNMAAVKTLMETVKEKLHEGFVLTPKSFILKTEFLSAKTKEAHEKLYNNYVKDFDKGSIKSSVVSTEESNSNNSEFRSYRRDEQTNLNAIKLHELYFTNISDTNSSIAVDTVAYMRLSRDFGTFEKWQFDFRACCVASREGWAVCYYEPLRKVYMNCIVDGHDSGIPLGGIPVIVIDMWSHAYYRDYLEDKKSYVNAMMKEINWNIIEARMVVAERSRAGDIFDIRPLVNEIPQKMLDGLDQGQAPIGNEQIETSDINVPESPVGGAKGSF